MHFPLVKSVNLPFWVHLNTSFFAFLLPYLPWKPFQQKLGKVHPFIRAVLTRHNQAGHKSRHDCNVPVFWLPFSTIILTHCSHAFLHLISIYVFVQSFRRGHTKSLQHLLELTAWIEADFPHLHRILISIVQHFHCFCCKRRLERAKRTKRHAVTNLHVVDETVKQSVHHSPGRVAVHTSRLSNLLHQLLITHLRIGQLLHLVASRLFVKEVESDFLFSKLNTHNYFLFD